MPQAAAAVLTRAEVLEAIDRLEQAVQAWEDDKDAPRVAWAGGLVKVPNEAIELASMQLIHLCDTPEAEDEAKPLILAVDIWEDRLTDWAKGRRDEPTITRPGGTMAMWDAYRALLSKRKPRRDRPPEPIAALLAGGVAPLQIARTYGFFDAGEPSIEMVFEERDQPGTHYNRETWKSPSYRAFLRKVALAWDERRSRTGRFSEMVESAAAMQEIQDQKRKHNKPTPEAPEPLDQLIRDEVPLAQILRMKPRETEESVLARAAELGVALDNTAWSYYNRQRPRHPAERVAEQQEAMNQVMAAAQVETYPELGDRDARILKMADAGLKASEIAEFLRGDYQDLSRQRVSSIVRQAQERAQASQTDPGGEEGDGATEG